IKAWLRAPIMHEEAGGGRRLKANPCGTPQGGVISPLLANIYLHPLDEGVNGCQQTPRMVRYADDLVILCRPGEGEAMKERLARCRQSFRQMNHYVGHRLRQWLWRKHGNPEGKYERWTDHILRTTYPLHVLPS